jgi:hypothetical protein
MSRSPAALIGQVLFGIPLKAALLLLMILIPVLGVWMASSMAVFSNRSVLLPILAGLLMFPVLPLLWEAIAAWRWKRKGSTDVRYLTGFERLVLRTVVLSGLFIGGLLFAYPQHAFTALSSHGDWFLRDARGPRAEMVRALLFKTADKLEWLCRRSRTNPFREIEQRRGKPTPPPDPSSLNPRPEPRPKPSTSTSMRPTSPEPPPGPPPWPQPAVVHELVTGLPADQETSLEAVARYFRDRTPGEEWRRARAIHDYIASRVAYDVPAYRSKNFPPQDAEAVFRTRQGVCAGYANLFKAMADAADLEAAYILGDARHSPDDLEEEKPVDGSSHAWNAVKLGGTWYLVDVTWDAGHVGEKFTRVFTANYFLTPPSIFGMTHFPEEATWQLLKRPLTRGEFIRQPMLRPGFFAAGLRLLRPDRAQVMAANELQIEIENSKARYLLVDYVRPGEKNGTDCAVMGGSLAVARCRFKEPGTFDVRLCVSRQRYSKYSCEGTIRVNASF